MKLVILGISSFSIVMRKYIEKYTKDSVVAFSVDSKYIYQKSLDGLPVVAFEEIQTLYPQKDFHLLNTLGYRRMMEIRKSFHLRSKEMGYSLYTYISPMAEVNSHVGEGSILLNGVSIGFNCSIGDGGIYWQNARIGEMSIIKDFTYWAPSSVGCGNLDVGERCFIGANATLRNGISLAPLTLVGAGVYMGRSVIEPNKAFKNVYPIEIPKPSDECL